MADRAIEVEVAYADAEHRVLRHLAMPEGGTVMQALELSGIRQALPDEVFNSLRLGIFARRVNLDQVVQDGDRIEIYRPLMLDPMEARRRRARERR